VAIPADNATPQPRPRKPGRDAEVSRELALAIILDPGSYYVNVPSGLMGDLVLFAMWWAATTMTTLKIKGGEKAIGLWRLVFDLETEKLVSEE
jgi:hypothetical protein